jgi:2-phospho-L-lactate guanylyltransferase
MNLWLLIPVKPFSESKSRLADTLDVAQRAQLSRRLLRHVLQIARESDLFTRMLVISRDQTVLREATRAGTDVMLEQASGLNLALSTARKRAVAEGAEAISILPSDLPLVEASDLHRLLHAAPLSPSIAIAPSHDGGTNALFLHPPDAINFYFGPDSFRRHHEQATQAGMAVHVIHSTTLAFDIDWPNDLHLLKSMNTQPIT